MIVYVNNWLFLSLICNIPLYTIEFNGFNLHRKISTRFYTEQKNKNKNDEIHSFEINKAYSLSDLKIYPSGM